MTTIEVRKFLSRHFYNFSKNPPPKDMSRDEDIWILYQPNPDMPMTPDTAVVRKIPCGLLPHIGGIIGWTYVDTFKVLFNLGVQE